MIAASHPPAASFSAAGIRREIHFVRRRWREGAAGLVAAVAMIGSGIFSFTQIPSTNALAFQLAVIGTFLCICGAWLAAAGIRDLSGKLIVDDKGIRLTPAWAGFTLSWDELDRWSIEDRLGSGLPDICFWVRRSGIQRIVPRGLITSAEARSIREIVQVRSSHRVSARTDLSESVRNLSIAQR